MAFAIQNLGTPSSRTILRSSLMHAVIEAMDKRFREPLATAPKPQEAAPAINRHDRRKAAALGRRGRR